MFWTRQPADNAFTSYVIASWGSYQADKTRVREMTTHRLRLEGTDHFCLSLQGAVGDVAMSPGLKTL